jgi:hypothetical protein
VSRECHAGPPRADRGGGAYYPHCWHVESGHLRRVCCHCGRVERKRYIPDPDHGPHVQVSPITMWVYEGENQPVRKEKGK